MSLPKRVGDFVFSDKRFEETFAELLAAANPSRDYLETWIEVIDEAQAKSRFRLQADLPPVSNSYPKVIDGYTLDRAFRSICERHYDPATRRQHRALVAAKLKAARP